MQCILVLVLVVLLVEVTKFKNFWESVQFARVRAFEMSRNDWCAVVLAIVNGTAAIYIAWHLSAFGHLPPHFFQYPSDTFADLFHTIYWAYQDERYSDWRAIQPPFSFLLGRLISAKECFLLDDLE